MDMFQENPIGNMTQEEKDNYIKINGPVFQNEMRRIDNKNYYYELIIPEII